MGKIGHPSDGGAELLPSTVRDPRRWMGWAFRRLPAAGGGYGLFAALALAGVQGSLSRLDVLGLVALWVGILLGSLCALTCAALDTALIARVRATRARAVTAWGNAAVAGVLPVLLLLDIARSWPVLLPLLTVGPAAVVGVITWRSSPAAVAVTG